LQQAIAELYFKIKRCSKNISVTESFYMEHLESKEDREERLLVR